MGKKGVMDLKDAIHQIKWETCQECPFFIYPEDEFLDIKFPDEKVFWCDSGNPDRGDCGILFILKKVMK